jgi:hypothetical protein
METESNSHLPFLDIDIYKDQMAPWGTGCSENPPTLMCIRMWSHTTPDQ